MAKKIGAIVSLSIIGILIIATIIMANVDVNYKVRCEDPDAIYVMYNYTSSSNNGEVLYSNDERYNEIVDYINNASTESSLTALFNGTLFDKPTVVTDSSTGVSIPSTSNFYVVYRYNNPQVLMNGNSAYKGEDGNNYMYKELWFSVGQTNGSTELRVYIMPYYNSNGGVTTTDTYSKYYLLTADFTDLYNYLVDNNFNN